MLDSEIETQRLGPSPLFGAAGATGAAVAGMGVALLGRPELSLVTYVVVLVVGTAAIAFHRYAAMRDTMSAHGRVPSRAVRRAAFVPVLLIFIACAANAFVWASEVAKG